MLSAQNPNLPVPSGPAYDKAAAGVSALRHSGSGIRPEPVKPRPSDSSRQEPDTLRANWSGVLAMSLCVFALIASEFMPVSLLTPIATDLHVTEGMAGQGIPALRINHN